MSEVAFSTFLSHHSGRMGVRIRVSIVDNRCIVSTQLDIDTSLAYARPAYIVIGLLGFYHTHSCDCDVSTKLVPLSGSDIANDTVMTIFIASTIGTWH